MNTKLSKILFTLLALALLASCDDHVNYADEGLNFDIDKDFQTALEKNQMPMLAARLGCTNCHAMDHKVVGPAWKAVGKRYQNATTFEYNGKTYPLQEGLVQKISHGGNGNWGTEPMPSIDPKDSKHELIEKLVRFILETGKR